MAFSNTAILIAATCIASGNDLVTWKGGDYGYADLSGKIHVRYCLAYSGYNADTQNAAQQAIDAWNVVGTQTNTEFDQDCDSPDFTFTVNNNSCGAYAPASNTLYVSDSTIAGIAESLTTFQVGKAIFEHEIGHILGLADAGLNPPSPTIMKNMYLPAGSTCQEAIENATIAPVIQDDDAITVNGCMGTARSDNYSYPSDQVMEPSSVYNCYDVYNVTDTYYCASGGCTLMNETWEYLWTECTMQ